MSTIALQDIVEGQQRATNGLVTLLSQERTTVESTAREHNQQLSNLTSLSQNFLTFMPDVEQKFSALESSIRANCSNPDNAELQARVKDMLEVVANLGRIAEGFACSTGLRLVPVRSNDRNSPTCPS
jgi:flagellar biosynthesis/type III secretory pathway chaperone